MMPATSTPSAAHALLESPHLRSLKRLVGVFEEEATGPLDQASALADAFRARFGAHCSRRCRQYVDGIVRCFAREPHGRIDQGTSTNSGFVNDGIALSFTGAPDPVASTRTT
jgi:hypothetical protein